MQKFCHNRFFPLILIMINILIYCVIVFISLVINVCWSAYILRLSLVIHCFEFEKPYICNLEFKLDVFLVSNCSKV